MGSANYLAPEQIRAHPVDERTDLFSLGIILMRMLNGSTPFEADTLPAHLQRVVRNQPSGVERLDPDIRPLVVRLLAKDPSERPGSSEIVVQELEALLKKEFHYGGATVMH